jgi:hypothetical protein
LTAAAHDPTLYASPRVVSNLEDCSFYHSMDLPGIGEVKGAWDLRPRIDEYLGHVDFGAKRVLELGSADGYLTFHVERQGADVISYDLGESDTWDVVPYARQRAGASSLVEPSWVPTSEPGPSPMRRANNAYWLAHRAFDSKARLVHGDVYSVPVALGPVDISLFGCLLLHTENPFRALRRAVAITTDTVIVVDGLGFLRLPAPLRSVRARLPYQVRRPIMRFMPQFTTGAGPDGWWRLTPEIVQAFLGVLGFERSDASTHVQLYEGRRRRLFTVVAHRTVPMTAADQSRPGS